MSDQEAAMQQIARMILGLLLMDFKTQKLTASSLSDGYEGPSPEKLKELCLSKGISDVDFELAFKGLEQRGFIRTGPKVPAFRNIDNVIFAPIMVSKNDFTHLTEKGYQEAKEPAKSPAAGKHSSTMNFYNSPVSNSTLASGQTVTQNVQTQATGLRHAIEIFEAAVRRDVADETDRKDILDRLHAIEQAVDKPSMIQRYNLLMASLGDHITVLSFALPIIWDQIKQLPSWT